MNTENLLIILLFIACGGLGAIADFFERMSKALTSKDYVLRKEISE